MEHLKKSKKEIFELFGNDPHIYSSETWSYPIEMDRYGNILIASSLQFEDEIVSGIAFKVKE